MSKAPKSDGKAASGQPPSGPTRGGLNVVLVPVNLTVNGRARTITVESRTTLLDALRESLALTGTGKHRGAGLTLS
jgi:xanthine dehydrogenase YagT iron-sulfur-binding subunit